jgi:cytochrome c553
MRKILQFLAISVALCFFATTGSAQDSATTQPINSLERSALFPSRAMLDLGKNVASRACIDCHGLDGKSTAPGIPNLAGQRTVYLYRVLQAYRARERRADAMNHAIGFLNEEALLAVSAYYASLVPSRPVFAEGDEPVRVELDGADPFAGIREDMKKCDKCHGEDGNSTASGMPNLSAQDPAYFVESMQAYINGNRNHKLMAKLAAGLSEETLSRMGVYYAVQEPVRTSTVGDGNADLGRELSPPCASCHGEDGNASGADMPTLAGQDARYFTKAMLAYKNGKRDHAKMYEAVEPLSEADIRNLAAFYAGQEPVRRNVRAPLTTAEWLERCERCHGAGGNSTDPRFPMLAGQDRTYLASALQAYLNKTRSNSTMHAMSAPLGESDVEGIVEFFAASEPRAVLYIELPPEEKIDQ